jgi:hypothetical protein
LAPLSFDRFVLKYSLPSLIPTPSISKNVYAEEVAIFVENHIRTWANSPKDRNGNELVGKNLYLKVFDDSSDYRLGAQAGEREGWRYLGMGFAQALSNVDRHRIQNRDDAKRYALGVLGLGSLLLTQMRFEHEAILHTP